jgi:hypothetical protein
MKKFLKIAGIALFVIILILAVLPFLFKGKIFELVKSEVNKTVDARVDFEHPGLNFFRSFPNASVSLGNLCIVGINEFEGDTLFFAEKISATVNLKSLLGSGGYEITKVGVDKAKLHALVREDGKANWNIVKPDDSAETVAETESSDFKILLKEVKINDSDIYFDNDSSQMNLALAGLNLRLSGDMTADETRIKTDFTIESLGFSMDKVPYLSQARLKGDMAINADLKNSKFTLANNHFQLNEIKANLDGWVALHEDESIEMDIKLNAPETQFKDILSMIPLIYANDFKGLKASGKVTLDAAAKGIMAGELLPAFDARLNVADARFQYPGMPGSVTDINTDIHASNPGGSADNTIVDISGFHFALNGNPFDLKLHLSTPVSDPNLALSAQGKLNLAGIKDIYPLEDMDLSGLFDANLKLATRMSYIEKEQYEKVEASGTLNVQQMLIKSKDAKDIQIENAHLSFSPRYVDLSAFSAIIGNNDVKANGKLENFIPYFLKDETLKGNLAVNSNFLNLNDFMTDESAGSSAADSTAIGIIEIPKNIDFNLTGNFKQVIFDNLNMSNVAGQITVKGGKVDMKNLSMNALGGKLNVNGYYDTSKNPKQPDVSLALDIQEASFSKTFSTFISIQKIAPLFENLAGNYSTKFQMNAPLGEDFMPVLTSLTASGLLSSNSVEISDNPLLNGLSSTLKNESLKELKIKDLKLPFSIKEGRVTTNPFDIKFGDGNMNLQGSTGLDQSIDYIAKINLAGKLTNNYLNNVNVKIGGNFTSPKFSLDVKDAADQLLGKAADAVLGTGGGAALSQQASEQIEKQTENIRKQAKDAGDKLVAEAEKEGQKLIDEAKKVSNPLAKVAAVKTAEAGAKKLKDEAQKQADKLNTEAEKQIQTLKDKAEKPAQ